MCSSASLLSVLTSLAELTFWLIVALLVGIPQAEREKIFGRYYRVGGRQGHLYPGLDMGLYFARHIIERHGGKLCVESVEGQGSTFSFWLPGLPQSRHGESARVTSESERGWEYEEDSSSGR